jgi:hypothetical protein
LKNVLLLIFIFNFIVPRILIVHLKRFDNNQKKIKKFIKYDKEIDLSKFRENKKKNEKYAYRLSSVLVHQGNSIYSGHYYCYVRVSDSNWYCFNDHSVLKAEESEVLKQSPYLLLYEKVLDRNRIGYLKKDNKPKKESLNKKTSEEVKTKNKNVKKATSPNKSPSRGLR